MDTFVRLPAAAARYEPVDHGRATVGPLASPSGMGPRGARRPRLVAPASGLVAVLTLLTPAFARADASSCGGGVPCVVDGGAYAIELPKDRPARGVYVFFHGYKGSAEAQMGDRRLIETAHLHGLAFAAPDGEGGTWSHPNAPGTYRDEIAFTSAVLDDLQRRFGFGPEGVVIGGFSQGASMAWYTVCSLGDRIAASVTFSGVFWDPLPKPSDCAATPPLMIHFHGRADRTFPLAGRAIGNRWHQGDTVKSFAVERERAMCGPETTAETIGDVACKTATGCARGNSTLCLHDGGHSVEASRLDAALTRLGFER